MGEKPRIAALDQGTTSTRVLVVEPDGTPHIAASPKHTVRYPAEGYVEQDATELLANLGKALEAAGPVDAIGLANQGESCLAWDGETGEPLSPVIVWQDTRTAGLLAEMVDDGLAAEVAQRAGVPLDPYFSASKLAWILREFSHAQVAHKAGRLRLGTTDAFFLDWMTGHFATDVATASRTSLMNIDTGEWDPELCRLFGVPIECLPEIRTNIAGFGSIGKTPVTAAIVDQQAALYGHACRQPGDAKITFGTGAFALAVTGSTPPRAAMKDGLLPTVAWDLGDGIVYAIDGGVQDAGSAVEWALKAGLANSVEDFSGFASVPAIARGLAFVPAFSGLGSPHWDRSGAPLLVGLQPDMTRRDICQALLEGIAFMTVSIVEVLGKHAPLGEAISIDGGIARNAYFCQFLADCIGTSVIARGFDERTAFGTAALAALPLSVVLATPMAEDHTFVPNGADAKAWRARFGAAVERSTGWRTL